MYGKGNSITYNIIKNMWKEKEMISLKNYLKSERKSIVYCVTFLFTISLLLPTFVLIDFYIYGMRYSELFYLVVGVIEIGLILLAMREYNTLKNIKRVQSILLKNSPVKIKEGNLLKYESYYLKFIPVKINTKEFKRFKNDILSLVERSLSEVAGIFNKINYEPLRSSSESEIYFYKCDTIPIILSVGFSVIPRKLVIVGFQIISLKNLESTNREKIEEIKLRLSEEIKKLEENFEMWGDKR